MRTTDICLAVAVAWGVAATGYATHLYEQRSERAHAVVKRTHAVVRELQRHHNARFERMAKPDYQADLAVLAMLTRRAQRQAGWAK